MLHQAKVLSPSYEIKMSSSTCSIEQFEPLISPIVQFHDYLNYDDVEIN